MNAPFDTQSLIDECDRRKAIELQSQYGWYDSVGIRQGGLIAFVRYFWSVLEPDAPFVDGWPLWAMCEHLEAVTRGDIVRLLINVPPGFMKSMLTNIFWPAWEWGAVGHSSYRYVCFSYSASLTERDNDKFRVLVSSERYQALYGPIRIESEKAVTLENKTITKVKNTRTGWKLASSVGGVGTGERGDRVIIDDPHNVVESESEIVRGETIRWFRESVSSRLNNLDTGAIVVIGQRVHQYDVSGIIQSQDFDYEHLMIPWELDRDRVVDEGGKPFETAIGWYDPRLDDEDEEEPAWLDRFSERAMDRTRLEIGPYAWCNPGEAPVLMADLTMRRIDQVKEGDEVMGFEIGDKAKRARLKPARVLSVSRSVQPVVRVLLDSGQFIRCTPNHKWFTGRNDKSHKLYAPAHVGSRLRRVCPAFLQQCEGEDEHRLAGWLSGFFDGEGTVTVLNHRGVERSALISFCQNSGQNLPLCERLEYALARLGFDFGCIERQPTTLSASGVPWQKRRTYYLKSDAGEGFTGKGKPARRMSRLQMNQRFLHIIQPNKWRQRLIDVTANGRMYTTGERVLSIEPAGRDIVYGLETTTGNYVVWGLASSNSAQYQQSPAPRGGGLFKRHWWKPWESLDGKYPLFSYVIASLDVAVTEKAENNPSGFTVWGIFQPEDSDNPAIMLIDAWRKRVNMHGDPAPRQPQEIPQIGDDKQTVINRNVAWKRRTSEGWGLVEWVAYTCRVRYVDLLLIECEKGGIVAAQEMQRLYGGENWSVHLQPVKGDKHARAMAVVPTFSQGKVYAPVKDWAEMVIDEMEAFPKHRYDDLTDSTSMAIRYFRDAGLARTDEEIQAEVYERVRHKPQLKALYPV